MATMIKAIPTEYKGVTYRSKIEARWAVFFDLAGIRVQYEEEAYELPSGRYLPDFYIPQLGVFFEVKPDNWTDFTEHRELHEATGRPVIVALGPPANDLERYREARNSGFFMPISTYAAFGKVWGDCHGGGVMQEFYNVPSYWVDKFTWEEKKWALHFEPHKVEEEALDETERLMVRALNYPFPRWNPPVAEAGQHRRRETSTRPGDDGLFHSKFGAGIVHSYGRDEYEREIVYVTFIGANGTPTPSPLLASHVTIVDRRFTGWTKSAPERTMSARMIRPKKRFSINDGKWSDEGEPMSFCLECEGVYRPCFFAPARDGFAGWATVVEVYKTVDQRYGGYLYRVNKRMEDVTKQTSFYCTRCATALDKAVSNGGDHAGTASR